MSATILFFLRGESVIFTQKKIYPFQIAERQRPCNTFDALVLHSPLGTREIISSSVSIWGVAGIFTRKDYV